MAEVQTAPAIHQFKRGAAFRKLIRAPAGYTLMEFDFSGQEYRWLAVVSNDATMLSMCQPGEDAHGYMGASIRGVNYRSLVDLVKQGNAEAKNIRQLGKVANLSLGYKTSANTLRRVAAVQYKVPLSDQEAQGIWHTYQRTYPRVPIYWRKQQQLIRQQDYVENPMGRRVSLLPLHQRDTNYQWSYDLTAINFPIQSAGADQKYLALAVLKNLLPEWGGRFYFDLHDGIYLVIPNDKAHAAFDKLKHVLSNLPYKKAWGLDLPIQFPVDGKMGDSWGSLKEFA